tara:strand:+ start:15806 stop:16216 length:411 start_codon:yes stop_codon:yes gene_type:complete
MKLTKNQLKQLIKEELINELGEDWEKEVQTQEGLSPLTKEQAEALVQELNTTARGDTDINANELIAQDKGWVLPEWQRAKSLAIELIWVLAKSPDEMQHFGKTKHSVQSALSAYSKTSGFSGEAPYPSKDSAAEGE